MYLKFSIPGELHIERDAFYQALRETNTKTKPWSKWVTFLKKPRTQAFLRFLADEGLLVHCSFCKRDAHTNNMHINLCLLLLPQPLALRTLLLPCWCVLCVSPLALLSATTQNEGFQSLLALSARDGLQKTSPTYVELSSEEENLKLRRKRSSQEAIKKKN